MESAALELGLGSYEGPEEAQLIKHAGGRDKSHMEVTPDLWGTLCKTCTKDTVKRAEHRRTDAFELWCWRRLLRVPWKS